MQREKQMKIKMKIKGKKKSPGNPRLNQKK